MSWNPQIDVHYYNTSYPYNSAGSFMEYFEGRTYEHVNFIFHGASHVQESFYPSMNTRFYKFGLSESGSNSYYAFGHPYEVNYHEPQNDEYRRPSENSSRSSNEQNAPVNTERERNSNSSTRESSRECPRRHHNTLDYQVVWQDNIDPDNMTYEELLELGETVGSQSRGLSQQLISLLPISKYKCGFFGRKKSKHERKWLYAIFEEVLYGYLLKRFLRQYISGFTGCNVCVICQMEYKRGDRCITLPCKHVYHACCGTRWLSINKACPICYTEVFGDFSKRTENNHR